MDLVTFFKAVILGLVEGITEFLPISSTGHLILANKIIPISTRKEFIDSFEVIIQLGAIMAVVVFFFKKLWPFSNDKQETKDKLIMWSKIIVGVIPAIVIGLVYSKLHLKAILFNPIVVAVALVFYGIVIIVLENINKNKKEYKINSIKDVTYKLAIGVGFFQCLAMVPGTSRSAATIIGAMLLGFARFEAAEFSFFLAIPTMFAASAKDIMDSGLSFTATEWGIIAVGFVTAFLSALLVIKYFIKFVQTRDFKIFGYYRIVLGIVVLAYFVSQGQQI